MWEKLKKIGIGLGLTIVLLNTVNVFSEPGSDTDPLVTLSYVENKIEELKNYIDTENNKSENRLDYDSWKSVEVLAGQSLIGKEGTEIILRSGEARAIAIVVNDIMNGLTDITAGKDLVMEENVLPNHLLIIPRDDGRGVRVLKSSHFLIKGDYEIR